MKSYLAHSIAVTVLIVFVFGLDVIAQATQKVVAQIPFDFYVRDAKLPAGRYEFQPVSRHATSGTMIVRSIENSTRSILVPVFSHDQRVAGGDSPVIAFNQYGSLFFLSTVDLAGGSLALRLTKSSDERSIAAKRDPVRKITVRPLEGGN